MSVHPDSAPTGTADQAELQAVLAPLAAQAQAAARTTGKAVLLCFAVPLGASDPLALLQALGGDGGRAPAPGRKPSAAKPFRFYWEQPSSGLALAAGGVAQRIMGQGALRFRQSAEQVQALLRSAVSGGAGCKCPGPYVLGGFSFFDQVDEAQWPGFGPAQLVVPTWLAVRQGESCLAVVTVAVAPDAALHEVTATLLDRLHDLRRAAAEAPAEAGAGPGTETGPEPCPGPQRAFQQATTEEGRARWLEVVRLARDRIRAGLLTKVVLARALDLICEVAPSPLTMLRRLRAAYTGCYSFLVDPGAGAVFLGATPERMARFAGGHVELAALAGSMPRGGTPEADERNACRLLESHKERQEHQIVVDAILATIKGMGSVLSPPQPQVLRFPNVQHLYTPITLEPQGPLDMLSMLERLHPTAAVGGFPKAEAFAIIHECERFERGWYAAPVGWISAGGDGEFVVALRSGQLTGTRLRLFAGGGIVAESDPEREYEETQIKFQPLLTALTHG